MLNNFFENNDETPTMVTCAIKLIDAYKDDIDILLFKEELIHFLERATEEDIESVHIMYMVINSGLRSTLPTVEINFLKFLMLLVTNTCGVKPFPVLNRVKNYIRNSLGQSNLSKLSLMFIEAEMTNSLVCKDLIDLLKQQER